MNTVEIRIVCSLYYCYKSSYLSTRGIKRRWKHLLSAYRITTLFIDSIDNSIEEEDII